MKGDFTRITFDKSKHFSRVLKQQGRVELDADFNEQAAILLHRQQALAADLIGPHGTPLKSGEAEANGFKITGASSRDFHIGKGYYYVNGILCENEIETTYKNQVDYQQGAEKNGLIDGNYLVYLDVWERHISHLEDTDITEVGLGIHRPDTSTRAKVVWQVKVAQDISTCPNEEQWKGLLEDWQSRNRGMLKAATVQFETTDLENHCIIPPEARYRGAENQLFRIEIHKSGKANDATFKWSRDNGSVLFPIAAIRENKVTVQSLGRDDRSILRVDDWVEIIDDDYTLQNEPENLLQVISIDIDTNIVTLSNEPAEGVGRNLDKHPFMRLWHPGMKRSNQEEEPELAGDGALLVEENKWLTLEDGVQIYFASVPRTTNNEPQEEHDYRSGDYWLIPARTATRDVEWPGPVDNPEALPPHGEDHRFAPLWLISVLGGTVTAKTEDDCRHKFVSGIGPETDLQVRNLDVRGSLNVTGGTILNADVGVGTNNMTKPLTIRAQRTGEELIGFQDPTGATKWHINQNLGGNNPGLNFVETGVEDGRLFIQPGDNLGIGTTDPSKPLTIRARRTGEELIGFQDPDGTTKWHINQNLGGNKPGLNFVESGVEDGRLFIQPGDNLGIGTTDPSKPLTIRARRTGEELIGFQDPNGTTKWHINQNLGGNNPGLNFVETGVEDGRLFLKAGGNVGIGTPNPRFRLEVAGEAAKPGGGQWTTTSDMKLKKNVKTLEDALDILLQLRGISFEWKEPEKQGNLTGLQMGMVAQDVEKVIPAWVGTNPDGTKNLTIRGFEALIVEAVRELNNKVDRLLQRMDAVEQHLGITASSTPALKEDTPATEAEIKDGSRTTKKRTGKKSKK